MTDATRSSRMVSMFGSLMRRATSVMPMSSSTWMVFGTSTSSGSHCAQPPSVSMERSAAALGALDTSGSLPFHGPSAALSCARFLCALASR